MRDHLTSLDAIALARSPQEDARLNLLKQEMAERVMSSPAADVHPTRGA